MQADFNEDESLAFERQMREREIALAERRLEHEMRPSPKRAIFSNPLLIAVLAASAAAGAMQL